MKEEFSLKDVSVVIPTYNRHKDLKKTLNSFKKEISKIGEVIIIDQSLDDSTKKLVRGMGKKNLRYFHSKVPSLTKARNTGISKVSKRSKLVFFMDDDVTLGKNYFENMVKTFNRHPKVVGVGAHHPRALKDGKFNRFVKRIFLLDYITTKEKAQALSAYGNTYPFELTRDINVQWISGVNMAYKKEVLKKQRFDGNLVGYALAEDFDFTYRLYKRYPEGLMLTPNAKIKHRFSEVERWPTKKINYVNQINHIYLNFKNFNSTLVEKLKFMWVIFGISMLRSLYFLKTRKKSDGIKLRLFFSSLIYCILNLRSIRRGHLGFKE